MQQHILQEGKKTSIAKSARRVNNKEEEYSHKLRCTWEFIPFWNLHPAGVKLN